MLIKHEHYKACGVIWELRSQTWQRFHRAGFGLFLDIIPFSNKNSLSSCQGRKHPWVKEAFGQRPTVALQEVMDRCRCYLQAATLLWPLRLQGRWEEETFGGLGGRRARILLLHFQMYATLQRLARLPQPDRFCMRARTRTNVSLGVSGQTCRVNFPGSVMRPPPPPLKYGACKGRMVGAVCAKVDKMFQKEKKKKIRQFLFGAFGVRVRWFKFLFGRLLVPVKPFQSVHRKRALFYFADAVLMLQIMFSSFWFFRMQVFHLEDTRSVSSPLLNNLGGRKCGDAISDSSKTLSY